jgi:hypothetical protein
LERFPNFGMVSSFTPDGSRRGGDQEVEVGDEQSVSPQTETQMRKDFHDWLIQRQES